MGNLSKMQQTNQNPSAIRPPSRPELPIFSTHMFPWSYIQQALLAQSVERETLNLKAVGSTPT
ncbi:hypothetical protein DM01DRAFT_330870 [Hesseltinella vesiculosa]|uniref:Uncharacterized protein n=1 Tax=Hesseltinella vesiculosa TaxID=101127 RepID=A0A1X2GIS7_9FUNG|nr:hypothetical protein DM01DRAFT_330870 [Hesseltinella vesiculosa]